MIPVAAELMSTKVGIQFIRHIRHTGNENSEKRAVEVYTISIKYMINFQRSIVVK